MSFLVYPAVSGTRRDFAGSSVGSLRGKDFLSCGLKLSTERYFKCAPLPFPSADPVLGRKRFKPELRNLRDFNQALTLKNKRTALEWHRLKWMAGMRKSSFIKDALQALRSRWQWDRPASGNCLSEERRPRQRRATGV